MTRQITLFLVCAFEIALILFVAAWTAWAKEKIVNAEFKCVPYKGGSLVGHSHLTENPFRLVKPDEIEVVVKGEEIRVNHWGEWKLRRDHRSAVWVAGSTKNLFTEHMHIRITQDSETFEWKFKLAKNGTSQSLHVGTCQKK